MGNSGGAISMLSSSTLSNSDFYTGAFPAEFGNAYSGVFDIKLRKGNNEKREYALQASLLGFDGSLEGYFKKGNKALFCLLPCFKEYFQKSKNFIIPSEHVSVMSKSN